MLVGVLVGTAVVAAPAQAASFTKSAQLEADNTNLDAHDGTMVWNRDASIYFVAAPFRCESAPRRGGGRGDRRVMSPGREYEIGRDPLATWF